MKYFTMILSQLMASYFYKYNYQSQNIKGNYWLKYSYNYFDCENTFKVIKCSSFDLLVGLIKRYLNFIAFEIYQRLDRQKVNLISKPLLQNQLKISINKYMKIKIKKKWQQMKLKITQIIKQNKQKNKK
ncbi:hypothetical protein ABPG74_017893 [Tetrahymena malaccensis]